MARLYRCSAGIEFVVQHELIDVLRDDTVMICGGVNIKTPPQKDLSTGCAVSRAEGL